ncbi:MAG: histidine phosphatase family protein [Acidimicrobiales bacterium]|nr:MAG: histidine phosphatase family protein [Acidimicrobiales bacterium]
MELLIIRHALPVRRELTTGAADPELSEAGLAQAARLAEYLASEQIDAVYASPLARAQQTARPLLEHRHLEIVTSDGIAEWDQHSSEYVPVEELKAANDPRWHAMLAGEWSVDESEEDFRYRVVSSIETIIADHGGQRVAVVCHGGVINGYLSHVLGLDTFARGFFYPNYTSINRVAAASSGERSIVTVNETSHLRGTGLPMGLFQKG